MIHQEDIRLPFQDRYVLESLNENDKGQGTTPT